MDQGCGQMGMVGTIEGDGVHVISEMDDGI